MNTRSLALLSFFGFTFLSGSACPPDEETIEKTPPPKAPLPAKASNPTDEEDRKATKSDPEGRKPPHFLILGGGYSPSGNQVSLEKNVLYFRRVLGELGLLRSPRHLFFADGRDKGRDLQFMDPAFEIPETNRALAELLGSTKGIANQYRSNGLAPNGPSSLAELDKWLNQTGAKLKKDDQLLIYFTGHGGKGDKKYPHNTTVHLWNKQKVKMSDFTKRLDKLPVDTPVVMVMVQCYSGGFANVIFKEGDPKKGMAEHSRAGFFATVHNRVAAGCTPDIREENYQEYSTNFWEAISGKTRLGRIIEKPDFNGDGKISYAEAHAHVILSSDTIDVPVKTTDAFLRQYSRTLPDKNKKGDQEKADAWVKPTDRYADVLKCAGTAERAILEGLSTQLKLDDDNRDKEAKDLMNELEKQRRAFAEQKKKPEAERNRIKGKLATEVRKRWPESSNPYHPNARALFEPDQSKELLTILNKNGEWAKYLKAKEAISKLEKKRFELDRRKVKCMRFLRALENVALESNLPLVAEDATLARHEKLKALENNTLRAKEPDA